jgi:hypothetical protein
MSVDKLLIYKKSAYNLYNDKKALGMMSVEKMPVGKMTADKMTSCFQKNAIDKNNIFVRFKF